jgi:hypothetical protein
MSRDDRHVKKLHIGFVLAGRAITTNVRRISQI